MPQIKPGNSVTGQNGAPEIYGTTKTENNVPFQEKLARLFKPQEFVTVKNITGEKVYWQYMPIDSEREDFSEDGMQRIISRDTPELWEIPAGGTEVIVGASAYRALDVMYKNYSASTTLHRYSDPSSPLYNEDGKHIPKNFNFADGGAQDAFIKQAYLGKATPTFGGVEANTGPTPAEIKPMTTTPLEAPQYASPNDSNLKTAQELSNAGRAN